VLDNRGIVLFGKSSSLKRNKIWPEKKGRRKSTKKEEYLALFKSPGPD